MYGNFENGVPVGGRIDYVKILLAAAFFLLFIACINFTNLTTARSSKRAKEIGIRKVVGASRFSLIRQFMGEAFLTTLVALGLAIGLSEILLPQFLLITGKDVSFNYSSSLFWMGMSAIFLVTVFLSGAYPAFFLSSMNINRILKKQSHLQMSSGALRKVLVVSQFILSTILIIGAMVVTQQINFIQNKNLGLDRENLIYMNLRENMYDQNEAFRNELSQQAGIKEFIQVNQNPLWVGNNTNGFGWESQNEDDELYVSFINTDQNFVNMMNIDLVAGRDFSAELKTDTSNFIINETLAKMMDIENPVGTKAAFWGKEGTIIGIAKDFHFRPLHHKISPVVIRYDPIETFKIFVRTKAGQTEEAIASLEKISKQFAPSYPFSYRFLDERYEEFYKSEITTAKLARIFALIAIFISCLGLFGLTAFIAEQKTKEIGIRKVLGASVANIVTLLSLDFLKLIVVALLIASPIAYYLMKGWLMNYAYRINLNWQSILIAGVVALLIAVFTVSLQSFKAAIANPVESLKNE